MDQKIRVCTGADGVTLTYAISGEGPPLAMSTTWLTHLEHQCRSLACRPWLETSSRKHTVVRYGSRGCGLSDRAVGDVSFETWVRDIECVVEAAGSERFSLPGTCWGGPIGIEYAARQRERVSHLDHVGAEIGQHLPGPGARQDAGKFDDAETRQRLRHALKTPGQSSMINAGGGSKDPRHALTRVGNHQSRCAVAPNY